MTCPRSQRKLLSELRLELPPLAYEIDILSPPELMRSTSTLDASATKIIQELKSEQL